MQHEPKKYLYDILQAIQQIQEFTQGKTDQQYREDSLLRSAVERQFQIVGEALQQLDRNFPELAHQISEYRTIINFRHVLVHGYDRIEDDVVWGIVTSKLHILESEARSLLDMS